MGMLLTSLEIIEKIRALGLGNVAVRLASGAADIAEVRKVADDLIQAGMLLVDIVKKDDALAAAVKERLENALEILRGATPAATPAAETETKETQDEAEQPNA